MSAPLMATKAGRQVKCSAAGLHRSGTGASNDWRLVEGMLQPRTHLSWNPSRRSKARTSNSTLLPQMDLDPQIRNPLSGSSDLNTPLLYAGLLPPTRAPTTWMARCSRPPRHPRRCRYRTVQTRAASPPSARRWAARAPEPSAPRGPAGCRSGRRPRWAPPPLGSAARPLRRRRTRRIPPHHRLSTTAARGRPQQAAEVAPEPCVP